MAVVAAIALTTAGGVFLQRWDLRRENRYWAGVEDQQAERFLAAARDAERCQEHGRLGEPCGRCRNAPPESKGCYAKEFRNYAAQAAESAKAGRRRADKQ
jgi:hypothetical protein